MANPIIAGIPPGGIKETYEVKILVCYLLSVVDTTLSFDGICEVCTEGGVTDYFTLVTAVKELTESGQVFEGGSRLGLTKLGKETSQNLKQALPSSLRDSIVKRGMVLLAKLRKQNEVFAKILPEGSGFRVECSIKEGELSLFTMTFYAPDREQADVISRNFYSRAAGLYQSLIHTLTQ